MRLACPSCGEVLSLPEEKRGTMVACACGKKIKVPAAKRPVQVVKAPARDVDDEDDLLEVDDVDLVEDEAPRKKRRNQDKDDDDEAEAADEEPRGKKHKKKKKQRKQAATASVLGGIGALLVLVSIWFISNYFHGADDESTWLNKVRTFLENRGVHPVLAFSITAALGVVPFGCYLVYSSKSSILSVMPDSVDFCRTMPEEFPKLKEAKLAEYTSALGEIGFVQLQDYTPDMDIDPSITGFARLMVNEEQHCFAEINQTFMEDEAAVPMKCILISFLDDGWSVMTTDRKPTQESYLMRRPRAVWRSLPGDEPAELFQALLKLRKKMTKKLEVAIEEKDTAKAYFQHEKTATEERKEAVQSRWAIGVFLEQWVFERTPPREWLGEFEG